MVKVPCSSSSVVEFSICEECFLGACERMIQFKVNPMRLLILAVYWFKFVLAIEIVSRKRIFVL